MTDRVKGLIVTLEHDIRIDDIEAIEHAINMIKGVISVTPNVTSSDDHINRERIRYEYKNKLYNFLNTI